MGCVWPWTQKFLTKIILGVNSKRNIIYSRSCSVNLLIASYSIRWSIDADLGSFGSFGLAPQKSVHHYGQRKGLSPVSLRSFASYAFYFYAAGLLGAPSWHSGCALYLGEKFGETRLNIGWPVDLGLDSFASVLQVATCVPVIAAWRKSWLPSQLACTKKHRPC